MKLVSGVTYHPFDDKVYVHSVDSQRDYILNEIASDILEYCRANPNCSRQDICDRLAELYAVEDKDELRRDVTDFLDEMVGEKILCEDVDPYADESWSNTIPMEVASRFAEEHRLFSIAFELTYRCVERCIHCYIDDFAPDCSKHELTLDEYKDALRQARALGCVSVLFTGGEVLLRSELCDIVECAVELGFIVNVYTTGIGLNDKIFDRLCALKINGISFSLYSGEPKVHDAITGVPGSFDKTLRALLMFRAAGVNTFAKCVAMKQNFEHLESLYQLGRRLKFHVSVSPRVVSGHDQKCAADYSLSDEKLYRRLFELNNRYISSEPIEFDGDIRSRMLDGSACGAGLNSLSIDPFGGVHACLTFSKTFGSLRADSLRDIWERARDLKYLRNRRMREVTPRCETCEYLEHCQVCVAELYQTEGKNFADCGETFWIAKAAAEAKPS